MPLKARHIEYGFNVFLSGNPTEAGFNSATMAKVNDAGFGWVRFQLRWDELEPSPGKYNPAAYDTMIAAASGAGAKVLVSVAKAPAWANPSRPGALPQDPSSFGRTMQYLAGRYKGKVQAWEIWNEQNLAGEVGGAIDIPAYVGTLKAGYSGVKAADPGAVVLFGGLSPTGATDRSAALDDVQYLQEFYQYNGGEARNYFDALGSHAGSAQNPPDKKYPENPGSGECPPKYANLQGSCWRNSPEFYFRRVEDQRKVMEQYGDAVKQIWVTEFGWDSCVGLPEPNGYEYCSLNTEQEQADYLVRAFAWARDNWAWSGVMVVWNLNYQAIPGISPADEKYGWGLLRPDFSPRPAYTAVKTMAK